MSRTRIKICGLTREADVDDAVDAGADALGFVLYAKSPRHVGLDRAAELAARLPPFVTPVLLFVNASPSEVRARHRPAAAGAAAVPWRRDARAVRLAAGRPWMRAARMAPGFDLLDFARASKAHRPCCSTPMSRATVAAERLSIGH
jgi:phosphoribosylanthranilate isomerase